MIVFDAEWFEKHQNILLKFANTRIGRYILRIHGDRSGVGKNRIVRILPNMIEWESEGKRVAEIRTHDKYGKRLFYSFYPLWRMLHAIDEAASLFKAKLDFGFSSLTAYTEAGTSTQYIDGSAVRNSVAEAFSTIRSGIGTYYTSNNTGTGASISSASATDTYQMMQRTRMQFNATSLPDDCRIDSVTISLYANNDTYTALGNPTIHICQFILNGQSDTSMQNSDYNIANHGSTSFASFAYPSGWTASSYNTATFNSSGEVAISKTGPTRLSVRTAWDLNNSAPTWAAPTVMSGLGWSMADYYGTSQDPYMTVSYINGSQLLYRSEWGSDPGHAYADGSCKYADTSNYSAGTWSSWAAVTDDAMFKVHIEDTAGGSVGCVKGLFNYYKEDGTQKLMRVRGKYLDVRDTDATEGWKMIYSSFATDATTKCEGVNAYIDDAERLYITHAHTADLIYTAGTSGTAITNYRAKHIEQFRGRLYLGNVMVSSTAYPSRVLYSPIGLDTFNNAANGDWFDDMGEPITALKQYANNLYIWSENNMAAYDGYSFTYIPGGFGTPASRSVLEVDGVLFFYNRRGVWAYTGTGIPTLISRAVQGWIDVVSDPTAVSARLDPYGRYCLHIGDVTYDGLAISEVEIVYDPSNASWKVYPNHPFVCSTWQTSNELIVPYCGDTSSAAVYQADSGYNNNGAAIDSTWYSPLLDIGLPHDIKNFYKLHITHEPTGASEYLTVSYRINGETTWRQIAETVSNVDLSGSGDVTQKLLTLPPQVQGQFIQFRIIHSSSTSGFKVYKFGIEYDVVRRP